MARNGVIGVPGAPSCLSEHPAHLCQRWAVIITAFLGGPTTKPQDSRAKRGRDWLFAASRDSKKNEAKLR
jgi:hypothetical protein